MYKTYSENSIKEKSWSKICFCCFVWSHPASASSTPFWKAPYFSWPPVERVWNVKSPTWVSALCFRALHCWGSRMPVIAVDQECRATTLRCLWWKVRWGRKFLNGNQKANSQRGHFSLCQSGHRLLILTTILDFTPPISVPRQLIEFVKLHLAITKVLPRGSRRPLGIMEEMWLAALTGMDSLWFQKEYYFWNCLGFVGCLRCNQLLNLITLMIYIKSKWLKHKI